MNRYLSLFLIGAVGCTQLSTVPKPGDKYTLPKKSSLLMVGPDNVLPYGTSKVGQVSFDIAINQEDIVIYVGTSDPKFRTPEGLSINSTLEEVRAAGATQPEVEAGWAYHTKLPSGWYVAFVVGSGRTDGPPQPQSRVSWFFKRR